jgi:N-acylneuraminate cytidylyltransferase
MYNNKSILTIIPARGGSKGIPKKNIKLLGEKPLIGWSIDAAKKSSLIDKIIVSSDSEEIISTSKKHEAEVPFVRPSELANDTATTKDVLIHTIKHFKEQNKHFDYIVLLQPTSPFRKDDDIDKMIVKAIESDSDMIVSVKETSSNPYYVLFEENKDGFLKKSKEGSFTRRQDCPTVYEYNGSIYVIKVSSLLEQNTMAFNKTIKYIMEDQYSIDLDTPFDWKQAEFFLNEYYL